MKKLVALLLCALTVIGAFTGCTSTDQPSDSTAAESTAGEIPHSLQVGYSRIDISPTSVVPLGGRHGTVYSNGTIVDPLYATCIAFTDETGNTLLLFELDVLQSYGEFNAARLKIAKATGVNGLQILMCATHNHSGPNLGQTDDPGIAAYIETLPDKLVQVAEEAMADRKTVTGTYITEAYPEGLNFCRHHILEDGSRTGWASPATKSAVKHLLDADNQLQLMKFTREGGKDVVLVNWQGHPNAASAGSFDIRSDVDVVRRELEALLDCHFAYFLGASGNVNSSSYVKSEIQSDWYIKDYVTRCKKLAQYGAEAAANFQKVETAKLQFIGGKYSAQSITGTNMSDIQIYAFSFGDIAFTLAPYEMFTENGQTIKKESPFKMTFVSTCSTGSIGYLPSAYAFEYDAYETSITKYAKGTAEGITQEHIKILKEIYTAK